MLDLPSWSTSASATNATVFVAIDLSRTSWVVALQTSGDTRVAVLHGSGERAH
jgi:hypothetical protein